MNFIYNMLKADKNDEKADSINIKAFNKIANAEKNREDKINELKMSMKKLANRKKGILSTSMNDFLSVYEKIIKINFNKNEPIREIQNNFLALNTVNEISNMVHVSNMAMTDKQMIVTFIFNFFDISSLILKESEINLSTAGIRKKQSYLVEEKCNSECILYDFIVGRANKMSDLLAKLNLLFMNSIISTSNIIEENGFDRNNYSIEDKKQLMGCMNLASTIKKIIDAKIVDENGEIIEKSIEVINLGEEYLKRVNSLID